MFLYQIWHIFETIFYQLWHILYANFGIDPRLA